MFFIRTAISTLQRFNATTRSFSFADTKLPKNRIENLFDVDVADYLSNRPQRFVKIDCDIFRRQRLAQRCSCAIARFQCPAQAIAVPGIDRDCAFRSQILLSDARQNFLLQFRQTFSRDAGNPQRREIFPIAVLGQIAFIQNKDLV